jgi:hypothetical protein
MSDLYLNHFYHAVHLAVIALSTFGWLWSRFHVLHVALLISILLSWGVAGIFYGFGYCFLTDWHWEVRRRLGIRDDPHSYTKLLFDAVTGREIAPFIVDFVTVIGLVIGVTGAFWRRSRKG